MIRFVIPAYNEAENIPRLLSDLTPVARHLGARVIFVDDGSTDGTADVIREHSGDLHYAIVPHTVNRGLGTAINTGIRAALGEASDDDAIVTLEADTTSNLGDLPAMMERFDAGADIVLASVYAPGGEIVGVAGWRLAASKSVSNTFRYLGGLRQIHTLSSLYRVYRAGTLRRAADTYGYLLVREPGFAANVELLLKLYNAGAIVTEVPTTNDWTTRKGESKMQLKPTVIAYMRLMAAHLVGRIQPPPVSPLAEATAALPVPRSGPGEAVERPPAVAQAG
ncbi:MAG TPA: glycosyltransferase [Solirubrobacterales bacterium]|jgi:dolichol-phosphate mannosyltransferase|nr:glycosyltransferase [Solirubrobacterales bacterium]